MIGWLVSIFTRETIASLTGSLERAFAAKLAAETDVQKIDAEKQIAFFQGQIALATSAAQNDRWWHPRELMGYGASAVVLKLFVWDTMLQIGVTPDPGPLVKGLLLTIVGFFYGNKMLSDTAGKILSGIVSKR